jgi:branched-chain amino acid transport system permease protein
MGVVLYSTIYRLLHRRGGGALIGLLCSLGIYTAAQNLIQLFFGTKNQPLQNWPVREGVAIGGARITSLQLYDAVATMAVLLCIAFLLARTRVGRNLRAIGNDIELAVCVGIPVERDKLISAFLAYSIGGVAGTLTALESNLRPTMGFDALLAGVVAAIVGGTGSLLGAFWGGLFVGVITHLGIWKLDSEWQAAMMFAILLLFLLVRPAGFLGIPRSG